MAKTVIEITDLGKQYRLGQVGTTTLMADFKRWQYRIRGKEDPFLKIGEENDRSKKGESEYVWALKNINFSVQQGEVLGIIGKNGAGKSTIIKMIAGLINPTAGKIIFNDEPITKNTVYKNLSAVLEGTRNVYWRLNPLENLHYFANLRGISSSEVKEKATELLEALEIEGKKKTRANIFREGCYKNLLLV
jgi:lipopolysaccharide transport system ATP-binding protein